MLDCLISSKNTWLLCYLELVSLIRVKNVKKGENNEEISERNKNLCDVSVLAAFRRWGRRDGRKEGGGVVVVSQLEKDWIMAVRKVSANTNSPWPHGNVGVLEYSHPTTHPHLPPPLLLFNPNHNIDTKSRLFLHSIHIIPVYLEYMHLT